jgi:hypothetical protein
MQIFKVMKNGEAHEIQGNQPIHELLDTHESYILCDDENRVVYLWKGDLSNVRSKFVGARIFQQIRSQVGLNYRNVAIDEEDLINGKYPEFIASIQKCRADGNAHEIRVKGVEIPIEEPKKIPRKEVPELPTKPSKSPIHSHGIKTDERIMIEILGEIRMYLREMNSSLKRIEKFHTFQK